MLLRTYVLCFLVLSVGGCKESRENAKQHSQKLAVTETEIQKNQFEDLDGNSFAVADFKGKRVILNYWATWCKPCIAEMPSLVRAQELLGEENYTFILVSDQSPTVIKDFKAKKGFNLMFIKYNGALANLQINALPTTFVYDSSGNQSFRVEGAVDWDSSEMLHKLKNIP
ncbi:TlpA disulfide reductase family protein [Arenibacter sp. GZD96]|uniref:TlpA family protein disulfide reductase n=1 Tax=Aurantibrevibacter litoralis TaxID=3106030 RepID=UPI002AFEF11B|nr:TlpA disulfide reductase family protein [Arenibacter sp. GZD-96]MEA1786381.1 TlpA disulfide reductase family protein [Arenibacter sp. GZD-96]